MIAVANRRLSKLAIDLLMLVAMPVMFLISMYPVATFSSEYSDLETMTLQKELKSAIGAQRFPILAELLKKEHLVNKDVLDSYLEESLASITLRPDNVEKIDVLNRLGWHLASRGDAAKSLELSLQALALSISDGDKARQADSLYQKALSLFYLSRAEEAATTASESAALFERQDNKRKASRSYTLLGAIYRSQSKFDLSIDAHHKALELSTDVGDQSGIAKSTNNIGLIYWNLGEHLKAKEYIESVLDFYRSKDNKSQLATSLNNLGLVYIETEEPEKALVFLQEGLELSSEEINPRSFALLNSNVGFAYKALGNNSLAMSYLEKSLAYRESVDDRWGMSRVLGFMGSIHFEQMEYEVAERKLKRGLKYALDANAINEISEISFTLSDLYTATNSQSEALKALRQAHRYREILNKENALEKLARMENLNELAQKDIELLRNKQRQVVLIAASLLMFALTIQVALYARSRSRTLSSIRSYVLKLEEKTTSLLESEQRYKSLFNDAVVPKFLVDLESERIIDANEPAQILSDVSGKDVFVKDLAPKWLRESMETISTMDEQEAQVSLSWLNREYERQFSDIWFNRVQLDGQQCVLVTVHDATRERRIEVERLRIDKLESLGSLAGRVAHDFNNALFAVLSHITLARRRLDPESKSSAFLIEAEKAVDQSTKITDNLIAFARGGEPRRELHDIRSILPTAVQFFLSGSGTEGEMDIDEDLSPVSIDLNQFKQLIHNLILNGREAMSDSGVLKIRARNFWTDQSISPSTPRGNYVKIEVQDTGVGIDVDHKDKVLDPFFTTKLGHEGIGLASAFAIATRHDGWLEFESEKGTGSTFTVYLPAKEVLKDSVSDKIDSASDSGGYLLVMDDDIAIQKVYRAALTRMGYEVVIVGDGESAVSTYQDALERRPFDLIIMDLTVPGGMGGKEAMKAIHSIDPDALGIVCSGYSHDPVMSNYQDAGFVAALTKPFSLNKLRETLSTALLEHDNKRIRDFV